MKIILGEKQSRRMYFITSNNDNYIYHCDWFLLCTGCIESVYTRGRAGVPVV